MEKNGKEFHLRRLLFIFLLATFFSEIAFLGEETKAASVPPIKIAVVYPLSGGLSRNGNLHTQSIKAAMGWVNDNGGIKSLGGAKLVPVVADTGNTVEGAASAMERVLRDREIIMATGCWASSFTLAATEVSERMGVPHFSISFADSLTERGYKWGFYVSPPNSVFGEMGVANVINLAKAAGKIPKTAMIVGDNQAASAGFYNATKEYFKKVGIEFIGEELWPMGTLTDATPFMQKVKNLNPDIVIFSSTAIADAQMCLMKKHEFNIKIPFLAGGGWLADPSFRQIGVNYLEGMFALSPAFPHKLTPAEWIKRSLDQCRKEYSDEPWVGQELDYGWTQIPIMAEILERAKSRDKQEIWKAARELDIHDVMAARATAGQGMAFDKTGRVVKKYQNVLIVQWQKGTPRTVYPPNLAVSAPYWVAK